MNQGDREKLDRLWRDWNVSCGMAEDADEPSRFAYWLVKHSGWGLVPPENLKDALGAIEMAKYVDPRRAQFAGQALQGLLANPEFGSCEESMIADFAVCQADALIAELDKEKP